MIRIAFLGLGAMGSRMAARLLAAGHDVTVWNRGPAKAVALAELGAKVAGSARAAASGAEIVFSMVRDDNASREVWFDRDHGALAGMSKGSVAVECSTLTLGWVRDWARQAGDMGMDVLDAPVAGSRPQAEGGQLVFLAGGSGEILDRVRPVLAAMGSAVHHAGSNGAGMATKLAVNALFGIQVAALAEIIGMLKQNGFDIARTAELIGLTPVMSPAARTAAGAMLTGAFAPLFPIELVDKDFGCVVEAAPLGDAAMPMAAAARRVMSAAIARGLGNDNLTAIVRLYAD